jgi:predicted DNA binding CopG/RHH family protein
MIIKNKQINIKVSESELNQIKEKTKQLKFNTVSEYIRFIILNAKVEVSSNGKTFIV